MIPRRKILLSAGVSAVVAVSGCPSFGSAPDTSPPSAADGPGEPRVPEVETRPDEGEVPAIPSRPGSLTERGVVEYIDAYEYALAYRRNTHRGQLREFFLDGAAEAVWTGDDGVRCEFDELVPTDDTSATTGRSTSSTWDDTPPLIWSPTTQFGAPKADRQNKLDG